MNMRSGSARRSMRRTSSATSRASIGRGGLAKEPADYQLFSRAASALPAGERLDFLLTLARAAIVNGRFDAASAAATEALRDAPANSSGRGAGAALPERRPDFPRTAPTPRWRICNALAKLDPSDAALLAAIRDAAAQFRLTPSPAAVEAASSLGRRREGRRRGADDPGRRGGAQADREPRRAAGGAP